MNQSEYHNIYTNESIHWYYKGYHQILLTFIKNYKQENRGQLRKLKILDAGCGTGLLSQKLKEFGDVWGVDISIKAVKLAKSRGVKVQKASIEKLPFNKSFFDIIVSADVIYHQSVSNDLKALRELKRVLRPGGLLLIKLPAFNFLYGLHDRYVQGKKRYRIRELEDLLISLNLMPIRSTYFGSFLVPVVIIKNFADKILPPGNLYSSVSSANRVINYLMLLIFNAEGFLLNYINIPIGITLLSVSKKKD